MRNRANLAKILQQIEAALRHQEYEFELRRTKLQLHLEDEPFDEKEIKSQLAMAEIEDSILASKLVRAKIFKQLYIEDNYCLICPFCYVDRNFSSVIQSTEAHPENDFTDYECSYCALHIPGQYHAAGKMKVKLKSNSDYH